MKLSKGQNQYISQMDRYEEKVISNDAEK